MNWWVSAPTHKRSRTDLDFLPESKSAENQILSTANRQSAAMESTNGKYTKVEWRVANKDIVDSINELFISNDLDDFISAVYYPKKQ